MLLALVIQFFEAFSVHVNFTADFKKFRGAVAQALRHRPNRPNVLGDIVAHASISARCCLAKPAVFVNERHRNAVHLWFDYHRDFFVRQKPLNARVEILHFFFRVSVVEAKHRNEVRDLLERLERFPADPLGGRIWRDEIRELRLQIDQLFVEAIIVPVADYRGGFFVIEPIVFADFISQLLDSLRGFLLVHDYPARYERAKSRQWQRICRAMASLPFFAKIIKKTRSRRCACHTV